MARKPPDQVVGNAAQGGQFATPPAAPPPVMPEVGGYGPGGSYVIPGFSTNAAGEIISPNTVVTPQTTTQDTSNIDWADVYFGGFGLPSALKTQIAELGRKYGTTNPDVFYQSAQSLIRQSDWFHTTFPGFDSGVRAGLFTDETGYRGYLNQLNQVYKQYAGRDVTGDEVNAALGEGATSDTFARRFAADAYLKANTNDLQYMEGAFGQGQLSDAELKAYGQEQAGIDTPLGQMVAHRLDMAKQRFQTVFQGRLASPGLTLGRNGVSAPGLLGTRQTPDVSA